MILWCHGSSTAAKDGKPEKGLFTPGLAILALATPSDAGGVVYDVLLSGLTPSKGGGEFLFRFQGVIFTVNSIVAKPGVEKKASI